MRAERRAREWQLGGLERKDAVSITKPEVHEERVRFTAKTDGQRLYCEAIHNHDVTFCTGLPGTGKTFLAVAEAVEALQSKRVSRICLARPAIGAGEDIGFLPGKLNQKLEPFMRPVMDSLNELLGAACVLRRIQLNDIEVCSISHMRGRTLKDAFILLDEAQNTTVEQMKMVLTRLGVGSKMVITGDLSQNDLPRGTVSGLADAVKRLVGIPSVGFCALTGEDIQRHAVVKLIVDAYGRAA